VLFCHHKHWDAIRENFKFEFNWNNWDSVSTHFIVAKCYQISIWNRCFIAAAYVTQATQVSPMGMHAQLFPFVLLQNQPSEKYKGHMSSQKCSCLIGGPVTSKINGTYIIKSQNFTIFWTTWNIVNVLTLLRVHFYKDSTISLELIYPEVFPTPDHFLFSYNLQQSNHIVKINKDRVTLNSHNLVNTES
jgi:hypothetical protein